MGATDEPLEVHMIKELVTKFYANKGPFIVKIWLLDYVGYALFGAGLLLVTKNDQPFISLELFKVLGVVLLWYIGNKLADKVQERRDFNAYMKEVNNGAKVKLTQEQKRERPGIAWPVACLRMAPLVVLVGGVIFLFLEPLRHPVGAYMTAICFVGSVLVVPYWDGFRLSVREVSDQEVPEWVDRLPDRDQTVGGWREKLRSMTERSTSAEQPLHSPSGEDTALMSVTPDDDGVAPATHASASQPG